MRTRPVGAEDAAPRARIVPVAAPVPEPAFAWSGTGAVLERRGTVFHPRSRVMVDAVDQQGRTTEFLVDTGTSDAFVTAGAPAAATARVRPRPLDYETQGTPQIGDRWAARLPTLRLGGLVGADVPILLSDKTHSRTACGNILGMSLLAGLALEHDHASGRWTLVPGGGTPAGAAGQVRLERRTLPVVTVTGERGETAYALIDTGSPFTLYEQGTAPGRWRLSGTDGRPLLTLDAKTPAPWRGLRAGGRPIRVWIGLDALSTRSWRLDFATGVWTFR